MSRVPRMLCLDALAFPVWAFDGHFALPVVNSGWDSCSSSLLSRIVSDSSSCWYTRVNFVAGTDVLDYQLLSSYLPPFPFLRPTYS